MADPPAVPASEALDLAGVARILRRRGALIVLCTIVVAAAAFAFSEQQTKEYTATASLVFSNNPLSQQIAGLEASSGSSQLVQQASNIELVKLGDMAARTASRLGIGEAEVGEAIEVAGQGESSVVGVSATAASPALAARIANTYTRLFVAEQQRASQSFFDSALRLVEKQLARLPADQRFEPAGVSLQNRAQQLRLLKELRYGGVKVAQAAAVPTAPSAPNTRRNTLLGAILGLALGIGLALLLERFERERRLRDPDDLEAAYDLPLLGVVPRSPRLAVGARGVDLTQPERETFSLILARLRLFNAGEPRTILITSAAREEGKTTVARFLAEAGARLGARVLLLEADLRDPALAARLELPSGPWLSEVVCGEAPLEQGVRTVALGSPGDPNRATSFDVLAAGPHRSPNPGALTGSLIMAATLEKAKAEYDLVLLDTPPLTAVADAFPLLGQVDGVVVVARLGQARRDLSLRLRATLERAGAPRLGLIANAARRAAAETGSGYGLSAAADDSPPVALTVPAQSTSEINA